MSNIMMNMNIIDQIGFVSLDLPYSVIKPIKNEIDSIRNSNFSNTAKYNYALAGAIEHEYRLTESCDEFEKFITHIIPSYYEVYGLSHLKNSKMIFSQSDPGKKDFWVNFQKKAEYNPLHFHTGILSFVIWIDIPYDRELEMNLPNIKNQNMSGLPSTHAAFMFRYPNLNVRGGIGVYSIPLDKTFEGKMIIFPAHLMHEVSPFYTSDNYRVSVSGNLAFEEN